MSVLICGSFAFDNIMVFPDRFKNHILPDKVHILNVSFMVPELRREFGGCAGNIAFSLNLLGGDPIPMGTVGTDFDNYAKWMDECGISRDHVTVIDDTYTAQAFITTDLDDNQITAFHPGAMNFSHHNQVDRANGVKLGIISPDGRDGMIQHADQFAEAHIPFMFDPGQGMTLFDGDQLRRFIEQATWVTVNDYEWQLLQERTGLSEREVTQQVEALIVTRGGDGSTIFTKDGATGIPAVKASELNDPTGCGDAYRAGLLYGLVNGYDWKTTGRLAALMGSISIECYGTQNHHHGRDELMDRFEQNYGYRI